MRAPASSPSLSKNNPTTSFLYGLHSAGFTTNDELTNLYTSYRAERPEVGMFKADWSLPEPTQDKYSDDLLSNATAFGDAAVVTIARSGGEGFDLPRDVNKEMLTTRTSATRTTPRSTRTSRTARCPRTSWMSLVQSISVRPSRSNPVEAVSVVIEWLRD